MRNPSTSRSVRSALRGSAATFPAAVAAAFVLAACGSSSLSEDADAPAGRDASADQGTAKIALLVPQSGVFAPLGEDMEAGFRLYLDSHDGKLGGREIDLQVVDEGTGPETGVPAGQQLARDGELSAVVGVVNSAVALGIADAFTEAEIPLIVANAGAGDITATPRDYLWRTSFSNVEVAEALGAHVADEVDEGSVYLIAPDYAAGAEYLAGFREAFTAAGGKVADEAKPPFGSTSNYSPFLARIQNSDAKAVFAFFAGSEAVAFTKQYRELGLADDLPLYAAGFLTEGGVLSAQGDAALGIQSSLHYSDQLDTPGNAEFVEAYRAANDEAPTVYAVQAYDAARVLDEALTTGTSGQQVVEGLKKITEVESPRGTWTFSDGHGPVQKYYLREVTEGSDGVLVNEVLRELS